MTISVRKREMPTIALTGRIVDPDTGIVGGVSSTYTFSASTNDIVINSDDRSVTRQGMLIFYDEVKVDVSPPYAAYSYNGEADQNMVGSAVVSGTIVGQNCEVYGTLNGKDPSRTKKHLWQNRSRYIRFNATGSDNVVLKARTYYRGELSDVLTINFKVVGSNTKVVNNS